jgi:tetratricopeptide (TPR) repeat protein
LLLLGSATAADSKQQNHALEEASDGLLALDAAFRFASVLDVDPKDKARAQQGVVLDYVTIDEIETALERADQIDGWRRGMAYSLIAVELARRGDEARARQLIGKAESVRGEAEGWGGPRISSYVSQALAYLGELPRSVELSRSVAEADAQQYTGQSAATIALAHAVRGEFDVAMATLDGLDGHADIYLSWWAVAGRVDIAKLESLSREQRLQAMSVAMNAAQQVPGWKRAEALFLVAEAYRELDRKKQSREALRQAEEIVGPLSDDQAMKAPMLSALGRGWARLGKKKDAERVLAAAENAAAGARTLDRPSVLAYVASGYAELGDRDRTMKLYESALDTAGELANSRPRALAIVNVCRAMGRSKVALDETTLKQLDSLFDGLGDPW